MFQHFFRRISTSCWKIFCQLRKENKRSYLQLYFGWKLTIVSLLCLSMALYSIYWLLFHSYVFRWPCILSIDYCFTAMSFDGLVFYLLTIVSLLCLSMALYSIYWLLFHCYVFRWPCILSIDYCFTAMSFDGLVFYLLTNVSLYVFRWRCILSNI